MARKHDIRLAILTALARRSLLPLTLDRLAESLDIDAYGISREELIEELPGLIAHKYVTNHLQGRGGWLIAITAAGLDQVRRDADMDDFIYGDDAFIGRAPGQ